MQNRKRVLITGANGLLGCHALKALRENYDVHALVRALPILPVDGITYHFVDFSSAWSTDDFPSEIDTIIHLAQSDHFRNFPEKAQDIFQVNIESTARLLDYAQRVGAKRFIYASSGGVYGYGNTAFDENSPIVPHGQLGYYLGSKLCSEILAQNYTPMMNVIIMRFFFIYGPGQKRSMLIPRLIDNVEEERAIVLQGEEGIQINPIHVEDAVATLGNALKLDGSYTLNIAGPEVLSLRQIVTMIGSKLRKEPILIKTEDEPRHLIANIDAMKNLLHVPKIHMSDVISTLTTCDSV